jgi:uncharacterized protein
MTEMAPTPETNESRSPADPPRAGRIDAVDALRGFALLGILVVHMVEQYLAAPPPPPMETFGIFSLADRVVQGIDGLLFIGKFFPMFALLFGVSVVIQADRGSATSSAGRFTWRLMVLLGIGLAHHTLYRGDILSIYALLGLPLVALRHLGDRWLLASAAFLGLGGPRLCLLIGGALLGYPVDMTPPAGPELATYYDAVRRGDLPAIAVSNLRDGFLMKMEFQLGLFGRGYQTVAMFLLGILLARHRWHESLSTRLAALRRAWKGGLIAAGAALAIMALGAVVVGTPTASGMSRPQAMVFLTGYDVFNLGIAATLASGFLLLYHRRGLHRLLHHLVPVGRTALTVYVSQTVIGTWLLYGHGLGLLGRIGAATALLLALTVFAVQVVIARAWVTRFRYGPLEWVWRSMTMLEVAPIRAVREGAVRVSA